MNINFTYTEELVILDKVFNGIRKDSLRLVGGAVRNFLLGKEIYDYDFCSTFRPDEIKQILEDSGIKYLTMGEKHGTITALINNKSFEITTLREDQETDGRHAKVVYSDSYEIDSSRRDFTINALYLDFQSNIYDYHCGLSDIKNKLIKFIGNSALRIEEDYLRILRFFRFFAYYGDKMDEVSLENCVKCKDKLNELSGERISMEMIKILWSPKVVEVLKVMERTGILSEIMEFQKINFAYFEAFVSSKFDVCKIFPIVLILNNSDELNYLRSRWKLSNEDFRLCQTLLSRKGDKLYSDADIKKDLFLTRDRCFVKNLIALNSIVNGDVIDFDIDNHDIPKFPISGDDLKQLDLEPKEYGKVLSDLRGMFIKSDYRLSREELLEKFNRDNAGR